MKVIEKSKNEPFSFLTNKERKKMTEFATVSEMLAAQAELKRQQEEISRRIQKAQDLAPLHEVTNDEERFGVAILRVGNARVSMGELPEVARESIREILRGYVTNAYDQMGMEPPSVAEAEALPSNDDF